jgi:parallel beta-helix repeat protein
MGLTKVTNSMIANASANIRDFGASGDGVADDSTAFNSALSFLNSQGGGTLYLPVGDYDLNNVATPMYSNITICGEGKASILRNFVGGTYSSISNITWSNFRIIGYRYIWDTCSNMLFEDVDFENYDPTGVSTDSSRFCQFTNSQDIKIVRVKAINCQYAVWSGDGSGGSQTSQNKNILVEGCYFENTENYSFPAAVNIADGADVIVSNNIIKGFNHTSGNFGYGVYQGDNTAFKAQRIVVTGNTIDDCGMGVRIHSAGNITIANNVINMTLANSNCIANDGDADPIDASTPENCTISGNVANGGDITWVGVYKNVNITGNVVRNANRGINSYNSGAGDYIEYLTISSNTISNCQQSGIMLQDTSVASITGNTITNTNLAGGAAGYASSMISCYTNTNNVIVSNNIMIDNLGSSAAYYGVYFHSVSTNAEARKFSYNNIGYNLAAEFTGGWTGTPTAGSWLNGEKLYFPTPAAGVYIGTVCTTSGTAGTLVGVTGTGTSGTPTLTVNSASDLAVGMYITVDAANYRIKTISGTTVTLWSNLSTSPSSAAVSYTTPVFKNFGAIAA